VTASVSHPNPSSAGLPDAEAVARFLRSHPSFLEDHPDLLSGLQVSHQAGGRTVSLVERQVDVLRQRYKALELRLAELLRHGEEHDAISGKLQRWLRPLLAVRDPLELPDRITAGLRESFTVPQVALRVWSLPAPTPARDWAQAVDAATMAWADAHTVPVCGPRGEDAAARWFDDGGASTRSMARIALRVGANPHAFGLLVLGSADVNRFDPSMGTAFLERIAEITSAALSRLLPAGD